MVSGAQEENINVKAAFIHVVGDFLQSLGVLVAAVGMCGVGVSYLPTTRSFIFLQRTKATILGLPCIVAV
jgi:Co/Zn/Cd efflux system component